MDSGRKVACFLVINGNNYIHRKYYEEIDKLKLKHRYSFTYVFQKSRIFRNKIRIKGQKGTL